MPNSGFSRDLDPVALYDAPGRSPVRAPISAVPPVRLSGISTTVPSQAAGQAVDVDPAAGGRNLTFALNNPAVEVVNGLHGTSWYINNNCDPNGDRY